MEMNKGEIAQLNQDLLRPVFHTSGRFYWAVLFLAAIVAAALVSWGYQLWVGFGVAGLNRPAFWAFYITNCVFWIGIIHSGTLLSAILRLANRSEERRVGTACSSECYDEL